MRKRTSKKSIRESLNKDVEKYLRHGGEIHTFARGESGIQSTHYTDQQIAFEKRQERTPVDDVLKAIDERKEANKKSHKPSPKTTSKPKKKIIYDDFGEPLRVIWES